MFPNNIILILERKNVLTEPVRIIKHKALRLPIGWKFNGSDGPDIDIRLFI